MFVFNFYRECSIKRELKYYGVETIGKFTYHYEFGKRSSNDFQYYVDGVLYKASAKGLPVDFEHNVGKFYKIIYSEKYKDRIEVLYDEEVKDHEIILQAGFHVEELF